MAISEVVRVKVEAKRPIYELEYESPINQIGYNIGQFFKSLRTKKLRPTGALMCTYLSEPDEKLEKPLKYMMALTVSEERVGVTTEYAQHDALKITVNGSYKQISNAYQIIGGYIAKHNIEVTSPPYELYVKGPKLGFLMLGLVTEIYFPISK
jgi:effector-binding domain-containing protein